MKKSLLTILVIAILACLASAQNLVTWRLLSDSLSAAMHSSDEATSTAAESTFNGLATVSQYCKLQMTTVSSAPATITAFGP